MTLNQLYQESLQKWQEIQTEFISLCNDNVLFVFIKPRIETISNTYCSFCRNTIVTIDLPSKNCNKCKINKKICNYFTDNWFKQDYLYLKRGYIPLIEYGRKTKNKKEMIRWIKMMIYSLEYMEMKTRKSDDKEC